MVICSVPLTLKRLDRILSQEPTMTYRDHLNRWAIARLSHNPSGTQEWEVVARFRSWSDAQGHLQLLSKKTPAESFKVLFDVLTDKSDSLSSSPADPSLN